MYEFSTLEQFAQLWNNTIYSSPSNFFYSINQGKMRKLLVNNEEKVLETLMMFKKGILPEWEDKINS